MNHLILLPEERQADGTYLLNGDRAKYVSEFHRFECGKKYSAILLGEGRGELVLLDTDDTHFRFAAHIAPTESNRRPISLVCALCRPQTMKKVLQYAAMLRLERVLFVPSELGEKSYRSSKILQPENMQYELVKGLEQIGSPFPPEVQVLDRFEDLAGCLESSTATRILAEPKSERLLTDALQDTSVVLVAIGCESGWSESERSRLQELDFIEAQVTEDHLRVEVALVAIVSQIMAQI